MVPKIQARASPQDHERGGSSEPCLIPYNAKNEEIVETKSEDKPKNEYAEPFGSLWTLQRMRENNCRSLGIFRIWVHPKKQHEATWEELQRIIGLKDKQALAELEEYARPKQFIREGRGHQLDIPVVLQTLDNLKSFSVTALIDSGCMGSSIDEKFVKKYGLVTRKSPRPIPVYNADGTRNKAGPITEFVELVLKIQDHREIIELSVTNLGRSDLFIGHDWLKLHNPSIDWQEGTIKFTRCPSRCGHMMHILEPDEDEEEENSQIPLEEGERLFLMDYRSYLGLDKIHVRAKTTISSELAEASNANKVKKTFKDIVPAHYQDFAEVFAKQEFDALPQRRPWDHVIELTPGAKPIDCKIYPLNLEEQKMLDDFLEENLRSGRIRPSKSPMASPFFFVKKKDGSLRPVQDYRKLNEMTVKNRYPLPLISELVNKLKGARYFTKLDVRWGYNNVRIKEGDEWKAAFRTNRGLFEPLVMFFGLTNSPATFQTMMNDLFKDLISEGVVVVYLDDIMIFTQTLEEHRKIVRKVLQILQENKLYLKAEKCEFEATQVEYLGMIISQGYVGMDPVKVHGVSEWPVPKCKRDVQAFLGFTNFYRRFIKDYGEIARPLTSLTGKADWIWGESQQRAFEQIKESIVTAPVLIIPTDNEPYRVECDASDYAVGAVLSQMHEGKWHPVAFLSKSMTAVERNYEIYDKELLAMMTALDEWRHYLMGAKHEFEIWTDHKNLEYFKKPQKLNRRQARWVTELADYHFKLYHKPGKLHTKPDLLSRRVDHHRGQDDNENVTLLKPYWFRAMEFEVVQDNTFLERIRKSRRNSDIAIEKALLNKEKGWEEMDNIVTWHGRIYVPRDKKLREEIIQLNHDSIMAGHPGRYKTHELITRNYWWPRIRADVQMYVTGCEVCQRTKPRHDKLAAPLQPNEVPSRPWEIITVDMIGPLPESQGHDAILIIVDVAGKQIIPVPTNIELTSEGWAKILRDHVFVYHGLPRKIISDRGPQFVSKFIKALYELLGIEGNPSTAYHPQTDGQTERINQEIEQYLRVFVNHKQDDWAEWLPMAGFAYNDKVQSSTGFSPFYVNKGYHPWKGHEARREVKNVTAQQVVDQLKEVQSEAASAIKASQEMMKRYYDRTKKESRKYNIGDEVWLEGYNIKTNRPMKKLEDKRYGPFKIIEKIGKSAYKLQLPKTWRAIHPVFNEVVLSPYTAPVYTSQRKPPPPLPEIIDGEVEYNVEKILDSKVERGVLKYLVHWEGYPRSEETWEPASQLTHAQEAVKDFHKQYPSAPRPKPEQLRFIALEHLARPTEPSRMYPAWLFNWEDGVYERTLARSRGRDP